MDCWDAVANCLHWCGAVGAGLVGSLGRGRREGRAGDQRLPRRRHQLLRQRERKLSVTRSALHGDVLEARDDLAEGRGRLKDVLKQMTMPALVLGIDSDVLYPESEVKTLAAGLPNAEYTRVTSPHGHDAFLIEFPQVAARLRRFLEGLAIR